MSKFSANNNETSKKVHTIQFKMNILAYFLIILVLNCMSCVTASGASSAGVISDVKNSLANQDSRMIPAEVYPWNILGVPDYSFENDVSKRSSWQKLHGSWGKRNMIENGIAGSGYHSNDNFDDSNNAIRNANNIEENELDAHDGPTDRDYQELIKFEEIYSLPASVVNDLLKPNAALYNEKKRAWRNLNVAWGKRRPNNEWNKFRVGYCSRLLGCLDWYNYILKLDHLKNRDPELAQKEFEGSWGKREPGWNNLKGLWGKRSSNWNKLNSAWGKRSEDTIDSSNN